MIKIELDRVNGDYGFEAKDALGHTVRIDTSPDGGGTNFGVRPMQMLLMGLGGCSGIDIVSILKKQRQTIDGFSMKIEGEREAGKEPSIWKNVTIVFELTGNIDPDKAKAVAGRFFSIRVPYLLAHALSWAWEKYSQCSQGQLPPVFNCRRCSAEWKGNRFSNEKIRQRVGWRPSVPMQQAMQAFLAQFAPNRENHLNTLPLNQSGGY